MNNFLRELIEKVDNGHKLAEHEYKKLLDFIDAELNNIASKSSEEDSDMDFLTTSAEILEDVKKLLRFKIEKLDSPD